MKIGAHQSIAGGLHRAPQRASQINLECFQMFTRAPQTWQEASFGADQLAQFHMTCQKAGFGSGQMAVHASYLANICSENDVTRQKAISSLCSDARHCDALRVAYLVFHPGSPGKQGETAGIAMVAGAINEILDATTHVTLLIENTAGTGKSIGHSFEQIAAMIEMCRATSRIGCCFDTAHAFAAGYDLSTADTAATVFNEFDHIIGLDKLKWLHLNDSVTKKGSRIDRHARIGSGRIGLPFFEWLVNAPFTANICATLETPLEKNNTYEADISAVKALRRCQKSMP